MKLKAIRNAFISGLLLLAPVGVTLFVIQFLIKTLGGPSSRLFFFFVDESVTTRYPWVPYALTVASAILVVVIVTIIGWFSKLLLGRFMMSQFERLMSSVPLVRSVYSTVKQIIDTFVRNNTAVFSKTVLVEYPRKGVYALGFLTGDGRGEVQEKTSAYLLNVFLPTTPNPTSGFLLMFPRDEVIILDMSVTDGMKAIISGGAVMPESQAQKALKAQTEAGAGTPEAVAHATSPVPQEEK